MARANRIFSVATLSALALLAASCVMIDPTLGASYIPANQDISIHTVDIDLPVGQKYADSLQTTVSSRVAVGSLTTATYGTVNVGTALTITPATDSIVWGTDPIFKDMYISLTASSNQILNKDQAAIPQNIYVHQLKVGLDSTYVYSNSVSLADCKPELAVQGSMIYTGGDTLVLHFTKEFALPLFDMDRETLDSTELFASKFYGIYLHTDPVEPGTEGGRLNIFDAGSSQVTFTFSSINDAGRRRDTTVYFNLGTYNAVMSIEKERMFAESDDASGMIRYEGLTGLKPHIDAKVLRQRLDDWMAANDIDPDALMVCRATLEFPFEYTGSSNQFDTWPANLYPCRRLRGSTYTVYNPISERYTTAYDHGEINRSLFYFRSDAAIYLQSLIREKKEEVDENYDIWMIPTIEYTTSSSTSTSDYYDYYNYYASMYGYGYGGYGYGYGGYNPYGYGYGYGYGYPYGYGSSSSSGTTYYYVDSQNYWMCEINGTSAARHPVLRLTYTVLK